jgi:murein DD-endopeptidase MepM/ murein hydrolase activator NlpD
MRLRAATVLLLAALLGAPACAHAAGSADTAALQVALRGVRLYEGPIDGIAGAGTKAAVRRFQSRRGLAADGVAGPRTRYALGRRGRPLLGSRVLRLGRAGWDVAALQFRLAWRGFPSGDFDGGFGYRTDGAVRRFQRYAGVVPDGVVGPGTLRALRLPIPRSPIWLIRPVRAAIGAGFGPRDNRFHPGLDYPAASGTRVTAAGRGRVVFAGWDTGGYGNLVVVRHPRAVRSMYAHLSRIEVRRGQWVSAGSRVGAVGATGLATGPHLHFELRLRGAAIDPLTALR